jgi:hypothetical protein
VRRRRRSKADLKVGLYDLPSANCELPRDPGLELFFSLEAGRDRFGVAAGRILADADAEHLRDGVGRGVVTNDG